MAIKKSGENEKNAFPSWVKILLSVVTSAVIVTVWGMSILAEVNKKIDAQCTRNDRQDERLEKLEEDYENNLTRILKNTEDIVTKLNEKDKPSNK